MWKKIFAFSICKNLHELLYLILLLQTATLQFYTEYTLADLRPTVLELNPLLKSNKRPDLKTVRAKYNHPSVHVFQFTYSSLCNYFLLRTFGLRYFIFLYIYIFCIIFFLKRILYADFLWQIHDDDVACDLWLLIIIIFTTFSTECFIL